MHKNENPDVPQNISVHYLYKAGTAKRQGVIWTLLILIIISSILSAGMGTISISPEDTLLAVGHSCAVQIQNFLHTYLPPIGEIYDAIPLQIPAPSNPQAELIIVGFRLPRIILALVTGMALAMAGAVMQGLLRNPLASPFTLGVASGASFGATVAIVIGPAILGGIAGGYFLSAGEDTFIAFMAFVFGWGTMFVVYAVSRSRGAGLSTLILMGVVIGYIFSAATMAMQYFTTDEKLRNLTVWLMGGMWGASWTSVLIIVPVCMCSLIILELKAWDLNSLAAGDDVAKNLGINIDRLRFVGFVFSTLASSCCIAFTGTIGFIGLMGPHICRMIIGNDHRYLIPCAALLGALILLVCDTFARTIMSPVEVPVGVIMYVIGGGFFLFLIMRARGRGLY